MTRTRADALVLVNWKGVFYERYVLDQHVTALEGTNGAGKTTVMIAAYVVLLPDMSRLRFTNLGETGATGGDRGVWGRLGEVGRPSYAVLDFALPGGKRLVAGVHLERKGEPSVEPTPFVVRGLSPEVRLQHLLLLGQGDREVVPELPELRETAARLGGRLQTFTSAREYFGALFDEGVTPLRLGTDEERNKLNEMLRTSMTGGISRALTSELRSFLLKEEGGLAETLARMRANLDACRRTRGEVQEARRLEAEIGGVFEAGQVMFAAAFHATRERAEELARRVVEADAIRDAAAAALASAHAALARTVAELEALEHRRREGQEGLESARAWHARVTEALEATRALAGYVRALEEAQAAAAEAARAREEADAMRQGCRERLHAAQDAHGQAAQGLADLQRGIEHLHRAAGAHREAMRRLHEAEGCLAAAPLAPEEFAGRLAEARTELAEVDEARREAGTRLADAEAHGARWEAAMRSLRALVGEDVDASAAHAVALDALRRHRDRAALASRLPTIERELVEARRLEARQSRAREGAARLGVAFDEGGAAATLERLLGEVEAARAEYEEAARTARAEAAAAERRLTELEATRRDLAAREPEWRAHRDRAMRIEAELGTQVRDRAQLDAAREALAKRLAEARRDEAQARSDQERLLREARELVAAGGPFRPELLRLRDELGAELLAASFEDVPLGEAARLEARLGPLAQALVVDDPSRAALAAGHRAEALPNVLLVSREADLANLAAREDAANVRDGDVALMEHGALRVSRIPKHPSLGRRAREERAAELRREGEALSVVLEAARARRRALERGVADGDGLLSGQHVWLAGDPGPALLETTRERAEVETRREAQRSASARNAAAASALGPRHQALRALLAETVLLDPPDQAERARALEAERAQAAAALQQVQAHARNAEHLEREGDALRHAPLSVAEQERLRDALAALKVRRGMLDRGVEALEYVQANLEALRDEEAPRRLLGHEALVPALKAALREAEDRQRRAEAAAAEAERLHDAATAAFQDADARRRLAEQEHAAALGKLERLGVPGASEVAVAEAAREVARLAEALRAVEARRDVLLPARGAEETALQQATDRATETAEKAASERREAEPGIARWERLQERAAQHGLLAGTLLAGNALAAMRGSPNLRQAAQSQRVLLRERLAHARGGTALLTQLEVLQDGSEAALDEAYLELWLTVRDWLRTRLPAQVAERDDPREGLLRLRDQLSGLEERLDRQEGDLRGASEDVARGIDVQVRKARGQVSRLNRNLEGVSFGSIAGIRVRLQPVERMEQVLRALREGVAQALLFQAELPIEEALDEIFARYGGGRSGGSKLLDYREYVHLQVEIRRKAGADWEIANPTRLSTGEAIGVGAALMMVVLTEWERDATLLRGKRAHGSLRFLFLDEANRLSPDNLGVLFDLCQTLDLQLIIAAPEVAQAEGNTTYRLVRRIAPGGHEEVVVSGRRTRADA